LQNDWPNAKTLQTIDDPPDRQTPIQDFRTREPRPSSLSGLIEQAVPPLLWRHNGTTMAPRKYHSGANFQARTGINDAWNAAWHHLYVIKIDADKGTLWL